MRFGQWIGLFALVVSLYILWQIRQVVLVVFASIVLATVLNQFVLFLQKFRIKRGLAIAISFSLLLIIIASFLALIAPQIVDQLQQFTDFAPNALERMRTWNNWLQNAIPDQLLENIRGLRTLTQGLQSWLNQLVNNFFALLSRSLNIVLTLLLFLVLTIMLLTDPAPYRQGFILLFPAFYRPRVSEILSECETSLVGWIKGTLLTMCLIACLSYVGLLILGVRLPLVNALLAGLLEFIPNVGPTLSLIPPLLLALLDAPWKAAAVVALYFGIQQVESLIIVPLVMKSQVSLLPAVTILSVVIFAQFFGFLGLFLAIPLVIVFQICIKEILVKDILNNWQGNTISKRQLKNEDNGSANRTLEGSTVGARSDTKE
ncbi:AI-2E family transporter [Scytonema sp. UIC 10036]|uniref:AI-2E family transporter n=1 Tax=Scytonema sp. UIC 10036 TaxID=2304196 RepID=UPI001385C7D5|nr:AI-2E family transporter [Scytonema sp. UIC 10036]